METAADDPAEARRGQREAGEEWREKEEKEQQQPVVLVLLAGPEAAVCWRTSGTVEPDSPLLIADLAHRDPPTSRWEQVHGSKVYWTGSYLCSRAIKQQHTPTFWPPELVSKVTWENGTRPLSAAVCGTSFAL